MKEAGRYFEQKFDVVTAKTLIETVGTGIFHISGRLYFNGKASPYYIAFRFADSIGATADIAMKAGYISKFNSVYAEGEFKGPGFFVAYVLAESAAEMGFAGYIRRILG